jgi:tRNA threonylcarbamoyladenosine biosynthesis protein TsaE
MGTTAAVISHSEQETFNVARELAESLSVPAHVLLYGDLGAGKTAFARGLAVGFGIEDPGDVSSPTFTLVNQYRGRLRIYHIDLYRIETGAVDSLGLDDIFDDPGAAVIVEWAERMRGLEPSDAVRVFLEYLDADSRRIDVRLAPGSN